MNWKQEEVVRRLAKLYPEYACARGYKIKYVNYELDRELKARWIFCLCVYHLHHRILMMEKFIEKETQKIHGLQEAVVMF